VLSGYVITNTYFYQINNISDLFRFQFLRVGRLYPIHIFYLTLIAVIEVVKYLLETKFGITSPNNPAFSRNNWESFFLQLFLIQSIGNTGYSTSFNGPAWSISVEFYVYIMFGLAVLALKDKSRYLFSLLSLLSITLIAINPENYYIDLLRCTSGFFIGSLICIYRGNLSYLIKNTSNILIIILLIIFLSFKEYHKYDFIIYLLSGLLVISSLDENLLLKGLYKSKIITQLGILSYSIYMSHFLIIWIYNQYLRVVLKRSEKIIGLQSIPQLSIVETFLSIAVIIILIVITSSLSYKYIEKPARNNSRKYIDIKLARYGGHP
jgi:peptidoglycan/LPS O-acetylase OafA/YrhL